MKVRVAAPFLAGCIAGLLLAVGTVLAVRSGSALYDGDRGLFVAYVWAGACFVIGGGLVIFNGMELWK